MSAGSFDPDEALALILQAKFNEELKKSRQKEKENVPTPVSNKQSLIDPEWEVTDPCPDIHGLFIAFNDRFFWGRLLGVEVKWSPQMTSCAGICVYEGRNGLCSVRLSAPLLKLRPRSDLVETLLHEMIHAYLFVTHNNRDRDGHGPEFHKHMYRINREAGTNITVYHSFHAEVKVYQQHWWRCDGPCQRRQPYFGMVKRAKNRAPGPYDPWWGNHQAECGGRFVKVREPPDYKDKKKGKDAKATVKPSNGKDIRNFFKSPTSSSGSPISLSGKKVGSNIFGFNNFAEGRSSSSSNVTSLPAGSPLNRVTGFSDLSSAGNSPGGKSSSKKIFGGNGQTLGSGVDKSPYSNGQINGSGSRRGIGRGGMGRGGMLANRGGGTLVVTGNQNKSKDFDEPKPKSTPNQDFQIDNFKVFSGSGFTLGGPSSSSGCSKSRLLSLGAGPKQKKPKLLDSDHLEASDKKDENGDMCNCSVCNKRMPREEIDVHLESCSGLNNIFNNSNVVDVSEEKEIKDINNKYKVTSCPVCSLLVEGDINSHLDECLNTSGVINMFEEPPIEISDNDSPVKFLNKNVPKPKPSDDSDVEIIESENRVACPICGMRFGESRINEHVNQCIDSGDEM